jgi:hypothetical protein
MIAGDGSAGKSDPGQSCRRDYQEGHQSNHLETSGAFARAGGLVLRPKRPE